MNGSIFTFVCSTWNKAYSMYENSKLFKYVSPVLDWVYMVFKNSVVIKFIVMILVKLFVSIKNSLIVSSLYTILSKLYKSLKISKIIHSARKGFIPTFETSFAKRFIDKTYQVFSDAFSNSLLVSFVKRRGTVCYQQSSFICKVLRLPTNLISFLCKKSEKIIKKLVNNSFIQNSIQIYSSGFLSLNIRFFALIALFASLSGMAMGLALNNFNVRLIVVAVVSLILSYVKNISLADYINNNVLEKIYKVCFGFENLTLSDYRTKSSDNVYISAVVIGVLTGVFGGFNPLLYAFPIALMALRGIIFNPFYGMLLAIFIAPILPTMALVGVCVFTIIVVLAHKAYTGNFSIKVNRVGLCLVLFVIIALISTLCSSALVGSIGVLGMYIIFIGFYLIINDSINKEESLVTLLKYFSISAAFVSIYGILQYFFRWNIQNAWIDTQMFEDATMRAYSTLANPNVLGEYLLLAGPIVAAVLINYTKTVYEKVSYAIILFSVLLCLVLTQSRGCWIGFIVSAAIFVTYYRSKLWKFLPLLVIILPFVLPQTFINRILSIGDLSDTSTSYRVFIWLGTLDMLKDYWLGGIGLGEAAFNNVYPLYSYNAIVAPHSHNLYLQLVVESGIISLIIFVFAMCVYIKDMINIQQTGRRFGIVATAFMSGVIGFLVQSLFDYTFYNYRVMCIFFILIAFGGMLSNICTNSADKTKG